MSSQITSPNTEAAILSRVIQVEEGDLSQSAAEYLLSVRFGGTGHSSNEPALANCSAR